MESNERYCPYCGIVKPTKDFYIKYGAKNQYLPNCISCTNSIYKTGLMKYNNPAAGIWAASMANNVPFIKRVYEDIADVIAVKEGQRGRPPIPFATYYNKMKEYGQIYHGVIDSDATLGNYVELGEETKEKECEDKVDYSELIKVWGRFFDKDGEPDNEAYEFLEDKFQSYTAELLNCDTAMESQYRNLCIAEWHKRKADESGDIADIAKAQENVVKILKLLKLDDFQVESKDEREKFIDRLCWMIEETEPAEEEDREKYRDIAGYEGHFKEIMRSMRNLLVGSREYPNIPPEEM